MQHLPLSKRVIRGDRIERKIPSTVSVPSTVYFSLMNNSSSMFDLLRTELPLAPFLDTLIH